MNPTLEAKVLRYILWRVAVMVPTLLLISALVFTIMELPPGDYFKTYIAELRAQGEGVNLEDIEALKKEYGFDKPPVIRYFNWVTGMLQGDFGYSFEYGLPVTDVVGDRLWLTMAVSFLTIVFTWLIAFPIGIYSATHQYSWSDYGLTFLGLLGLATPNFMLALVFMYLANLWFGTSIGRLMDPIFFNQPMSWAKLESIMAHLWIPVIIIGTAGTAGMIRRLRANLLEELQKQYVTTARAKGLHPFKALIKYPMRMALNFFVSDIGSILPAIISGAEITAVVLSLETTGPLLLRALKSQDMYLAGSFLMFLAFLTVIGVLISDIALAILDPRIRLQGRSVK
jgi:peptide/nickel transport system permease protein